MAPAMSAPAMAVPMAIPATAPSDNPPFLTTVLNVGVGVDVAEVVRLPPVFERDDVDAPFVVEDPVVDRLEMLVVVAVDVELDLLKAKQSSGRAAVAAEVRLSTL